MVVSLSFDRYISLKSGSYPSQLVAITVSMISLEKKIKFGIWLLEVTCVQKLKDAIFFG